MIVMIIEMIDDYELAQWRDRLFIQNHLLYHQNSLTPLKSNYSNRTSRLFN